MLTQKLYRNGNSVAVTIPRQYLKDLKLRNGSEVIVDQDPEVGAIIITSKKAKKVSGKITPEFLKWLESFNKKYAPALKELAKR